MMSRCCCAMLCSGSRGKLKAGRYADFLTSPAWPNTRHTYLFKLKTELN